MGTPLDKDESEEARSEGAGDAEQQHTGLRRVFREQLDAIAGRRKRLAEQDIVGRTPLFYAAENGLEEEVREIIFSFRGTGMFPPRLALISQKDVTGRTAADVAEENGHEEIAQLLRSEEGRMEFFE
jgi:ankyrin repeat protein